ncbi:MAG: SDR family oxidoreductase [Candidatus Dadabacteria bacterium]|nr:MAG: SDR family oxidoreductase [Candidatus Dadabacteria bacterium]
MDPRFRLDGRRVLITGASSGFGRHFADVLSAAGAEVVLAARRRERLADAVRALTERGATAKAVALDVTDPASVQEAFAAAGPIDVLINNAGISRPGSTHTMDEADWQAVIDTNLTGAWRCAKTAISAWLERSAPGVIVNIASIVGLRVARELGAYAASKAAVVHLTRSLALDYGRLGIRTNAICPGYFATELTEDYLASPAGQKQMQRVPLGRQGRLEELDGALLLLASEMSSYMNGSIIAVDGGHLCSGL